MHECGICAIVGVVWTGGNNHSDLLTLHVLVLLCLTCTTCCCYEASVLPSHLSAIFSTCLYLASGHAPPAAPHRSSIDHQHHNRHHDAATNGSEARVSDSGAAEAAADLPHDPREEAAAQAALAVALAVDEEGVHVLVSEFLAGLEDVAGRGLGTCRLLAAYAKATKVDLQEHVDALLTVRGWGKGIGPTPRGLRSGVHQHLCACKQLPVELWRNVLLAQLAQEKHVAMHFCVKLGCRSLCACVVSITILVQAFVNLLITADDCKNGL